MHKSDFQYSVDEEMRWERQQSFVLEGAEDVGTGTMGRR
jgi:hypothetical protein